MSSATNERTRTAQNTGPSHQYQKQRQSGRSPHPKGGLPTPKHHQQRQQQQQRTKPPPQQQQQQQQPPPNRQPEVRPWGPRTSTTLPNPEPNRPQGRVRVQAGAGDKCVPPAKSKQKKRTAVPGRPVDLSALSMDSVIWSDETYDVTQLVNTYRDKLPVIVKIVQGYKARNGDDLEVNQVIQVHSFARQDRVRATTQTEGARLSLPADYPVEIFIKNDTSSERRTLASALVNKSLPFKALVTSIQEDIEVSTVNVLGKHLTVTERHTDLFLKINTIEDGWINQEGVHAVPGFLGARFSVAVGMRGASVGEWLDYYGMFARSVRHLRFQLLKGYEGIIIEDDVGGAIQTQPPRPNSGPVYENLDQDQQSNRASTLEPKPSSSNRLSHPYENWSKEKADDAQLLRNKWKSEKIRTRPTTLDADDGKRQSRQDSEEGFMPQTKLPDLVVTKKPETSPVGSPGRPETPFSDVDESEVEEMFRSVLDVAEEQETLRKEREAAERKKRQAELKEAEAKAAEERAEMQAKLARQAELIDEDERSRNNNNRVSDQNAKNTQMSSSRSSYPSLNTSTRSLREIEMVQSVDAVVHRDPSPRTSTRADSSDVVQSLVGQFQPDPRSPNLAGGGVFRASQRERGSETPKAVVQPTVVHQTPNDSQTSLVKIRISESNAKQPVLYSPSQERLTTSSSSITTMEDVPKLIDNLTVEDVCQCLHLLNMDEHFADFRKHQVDGNLLASIRENDLVQDFRLTPFNASKLMRFIRGWRPKIG